MPRLEIVLPEGARRIDHLLATLLAERGLTRSAIHRLMGEGRVLLDGIPVKPSNPGRSGQKVVVNLPEPEPSGLVPMEHPLTVLYEDEACLAVEKPAGLVTHPAKGHAHDTLVNVLVGKAIGMAAGFGPSRPGILHRLDKETSGVLLLAKNDAAHADLAAQFKDRQIEKTYWALVWGALERDPSEVDAPIGRDPRNRKRMAVVSDGRPARTSFRTLEVLPHVSLVEARPFTGRTHQIRVHLASLRHPVVGDALYGGHPENGLPSSLLRSRVRAAGRFFLHAHSLAFVSPAAGRVTVTSPLPEEFEAIIEEFRRHG